MKLINIILLLLLTGCQPNDADFDNKVSEFRTTEIGADIANNKFIPPYSSFEPLIEYTEWCNSVLWPLLSVEESSIDMAFLREEVFALAPVEVLRVKGLTIGLIDSGGGIDMIYPYLHGDAAYIMKPTPLARPVIKSMYDKYRNSTSFNKVMLLNSKQEKRTESFANADSLCFKADILTGILGGESRSREVIHEVSELVRKNTLASG
jgi:hypothetical protein